MHRRDFLQVLSALSLSGSRAEAVSDAASHSRRSGPPFQGAPIGPLELIAERGHLFDCSSCLFARGGKNVVTGGIGDETAILWDATTGKELRRFVHGRQIWDLAIHPRLDHLLTCGADHEAKLWDLSTGSLLKRFRKHTDVVLTAAFDATGKTVFTVGREGLICVWAPGSSKPHHSFRLGFPDLTAAAFDVQGTTMVGRFKNKTLKVFNPQNGAFVKELHVPESDPRAINEGSAEHPIVLSRDGSMAAAYALYSGLVVWDLASAQRLWSHSFLDDIAMAFSIDGARLLVMSSEFDSLSETSSQSGPRDFSAQTSRVTFYDAKSGTIGDDFPIYHGHFKDAPMTQDVAFRPDGKVFVAADTRGTAKLIQVAGAKEVVTLPRDNHPIASIAVSPEGNRLAIADSRSDIAIWDLQAGGVAQYLGPLDIQGKSIRFTRDGEAVAIDENNWFRRWSVSGEQRVDFNRQTEQGWLYPIRDDGALALRFPGRGPHVDPGDAFAHNAPLRFSRFGTRTAPVTICDPSTNKDKGLLLLSADSFGPALFGPDGDTVFAVLGDRLARLDLTSRRLSWTAAPQKDDINDLTVSSDGNRVLTAGNDGLAVLWNAHTGVPIRKLKAHPDGVTAVAFSPDGTLLFTGGIEGNGCLWNGDGERLRLLTGHSAELTSAAFVPQAALVATGSSDGTVRVWRIADGSLVCTLRRMEAGGWAVVTPDGRFDTDNLNEIRGLHWVFQDDPFHALAPENYLREFYEPRLLPRLLFSTRPDEFRPIRPLQSLNRAVPQRPAIRISRDSNADTVTAEVDVSGDSYTFEETAQTIRTGAYDLHLFRDGQLIRQFPEPKDTTPDGITGPELDQWQSDKLVTDYPATKTVTFREIKLPHRPDSQPVEFTAYSFSDARVKGVVGSALSAPLGGRPESRAFIIAIGVNSYAGSGWDLRYAVNDATNIIALLGSRLTDIGFIVESTPVLSDEIHKDATKKGIQLTIEHAARVASPDDIVFVFFSGHGYSGAKSEFYLLPSDARPTEINWTSPASTDLTRLISANDLAKSFRGMEAGEIVFVIDACHAAASVDPGGFKPSPLGVSGLGQLAYDKRMRVLAASQTNQTAEEMAGKIQDGILTYALAYEGLLAKQAVADDGRITLASWLGYSVKRVPELFKEAQTGEINDFGVPALRGVILNQAHQIPSKRLIQTPVFFDFRKSDGITIVRAGE
jgi:WD40 repeat protein